MKIKMQLPAAGNFSDDNYAANLREDDNVLVPVGQLATIASAQNAFELAEGQYLLVDSDGQTLTVDGVEAGVLSAPYLTALHTAEDEVAIFTVEGRELLTRSDDEGWRLRGAVPACVAVNFETTEAVELNLPTASVSLAESPTRQGSVTNVADQEAIAAALRATCVKMQNTAAAQGARIQPSLACWRICDANGKTLLEGVPQWLGEKSGFQLTSEVIANVTKNSDGEYTEVGSFILSANPWKASVKLKLTGEVSAFWRTRMAQLRIYVAPEIDFVTNGTISPISVNTSHEISTSLPGATKLDTTLLTEALARFWSEAQCVAIFTSPIASAGQSLAVNINTLGTRGSITSIAAAQAAVSHPHSFTAAVAHRSGTALFLADVRAVQAPPRLPYEYAYTLAEDSVAQSTVTSRGAAAMALNLPGPATLPPMIAVADPEASSITLQAENQMLTLPLQPSRCGRYAVWVDPNLAPKLPQWSTKMWKSPDCSAFVSEYPRSLAASTSEDPFSPVSITEICRTRAVRLHPPVGSSGGWNYGRQHLVLWSVDGVYALSIDRSLTTVSSSLLHDGIGVSRADAVALSPQCAYAASRGKLFRLTGARLEPIDCPTEATAVAWMAVKRELWVADSSGALAIITRNGRCYRRNDLRATRFAAQLVIDANSLARNPATELPTAIAVDWRRRVEHQLRSGRIGWHIDAEQARITLTLLADSGGTAQRVAALTVNGAINSPIAAAIFTPARCYATVRLAGTLTPPSRLTAVTLP